MATKLFYPLGKCEEQVVAKETESRLFVTLLLNDIKELIHEQPDIFSRKIIEEKKSDYYHYVKTTKNENGIIKKVGFCFTEKDGNIVIDICEYRFNNEQILSKLLGRFYYEPKTTEIKVSWVQYFSSMSNGLCLARIPEKNYLKEYKVYLK